VRESQLHGPYDKGLMRRGEVARRLISEGEDAFRMLAAVVWPGREWAEDAFRTRLLVCPRCVGHVPACGECGGTGFVSSARHELLTDDISVAYG
jgi:hypothetical protein